jgi:hypothetical protein
MKKKKEKRKKEGSRRCWNAKNILIVILQGSYTLIVHFANKYNYILHIVLAWQFQQKKCQIIN